MSEPAQTAPILIVGAGPTGLTLACSLALQGIPFRLIDQAPGPSIHSKALAIHARSLEVLEDLGALPAFLAEGRKLHDANVYAGGKRVIRIGFDELDAPHPFILILPQSRTEALLEARLEDLGGRVERGKRLADLAQDADAVRVRLEDADGLDEPAEASWLIGCDGAHSSVRRALGLDFKGLALEQSFILGDVNIEGFGHPEDELIFFLAEEGFLLYVPLPDGRARLVASEDGLGEGEPELDELLDLARRRSGRPELRLLDPGWLSRFRVHSRMVDTYRSGRVFLAGDAGHIHSPTGGQGMNTGMQDAYNLGWKLGYVARGIGRDILLESYQAERLGIAREVLRATGFITRMGLLRHPVSQAIRDHLMPIIGSLPVVLERARGRASGLSLSYHGSPIVEEERGGIFGGGRASAPAEAPGFRARRDFGAAPAAGDRAIDGPVRAALVGEATRLFEAALRGPRFALLLFDGFAPTVEGYRRLTEIGRRAEDDYGAILRAFVIVPEIAPDKGIPEALEWEGATFLDPDNALHDRYGATAECLYLIRPDGVVGFRSQPINEARLYGHLGRLLKTR